MTKWTAADLPDLTGRTVVVTGASGGLGLITARELARAGARVVLAVRTVNKGEQAARAMSGRTEVRQLDVASLASVREFAGEQRLVRPGVRAAADHADLQRDEGRD